MAVPLSTALLLLLASAAAPPAHHDGGGAAGTLPWRSWTLLNADSGASHQRDWPATVRRVQAEVLPAATAHNITHLQLSQQLSWNAEDMDINVSSAAVSQIARLAHARGIQVSIWTHELSQCPAHSLVAGKCVLDDALWAWLHAKYVQLWTQVPDVDGVVLTISETAFDVTCEADCRVSSNLTVPQRLVKLIHTVVAASPGKTVIMRAFVHTHANLELMLDALHEYAAVPAAPGSGELVVMAKAPPCDWSPYFPFNPVWNQWTNATAALRGKVKLVMEMDLGFEMLGQNAFVAPMVEPVLEMVRQARLIGAVGISARIERSCLGSEVSGFRGSCRPGQPNTQTLGSDAGNDVSLCALSRFLLDPNATTADVWTEWGGGHILGRSNNSAIAARWLRRVLEPMYDATTRAYFPLQQWTTQHSNIALWADTLADLTSYTVTARWVPSPTLAIANRRLLHPQLTDILDLMDDQAIPTAVAQRSLSVLESAVVAGALSADTIEGLKAKLKTTAIAYEVLRAVHLTQFGTQSLLELNNLAALPGDEKFLRGVVRSAMARLGSASAANLSWPIDSLNIDAFLSDAKNRLRPLEPPPPCPSGYVSLGAGACRDGKGRFLPYGKSSRLGVSAEECSVTSSGEKACLAFEHSSYNKCQYFCNSTCTLCPLAGDGGGLPTKGTGTLGQTCFLKTDRRSVKTDDGSHAAATITVTSHPQLPAPASPRMTGPAVTVWNASFSTCGANAHDNVDSPARAFIDAAGLVHLTASCRTSRLMAGPTLYSVKHECPIVLNSTNASSPALFADNEWISSTYSLGNNRIFGLLHNEYVLAVLLQACVC
jgi:hypothetical protein